MRFVSFAGWATRQSRKSQQRFVRQFLAYAETHWQEYDVLQKDLSNFDVALGLLVRQQSAAQTAEMIRALSSFWLARGYWQEALNYCDLVQPLLNGWRSEHVNNQQVEQCTN